MSDTYEAEIQRQSGGPFSRSAERKTIRWVAERAVRRQRYLDERKRFWQRFSWWVGLGTPVALAIIKVTEALFTKVP